jgi:hypothetical protein
MRRLLAAALAALTVTGPAFAKPPPHYWTHHGHHWARFHEPYAPPPAGSGMNGGAESGCPQPISSLRT